MSRLCIVLTLLLGGTLAQTATAGSTLIRDFAACAGRYSASLERDWLLDLPSADRDAHQRAAFIELLEALLPYAREEGLTGREILHSVSYTHLTLPTTSRV